MHEEVGTTKLVKLCIMLSYIDKKLLITFLYRKETFEFKAYGPAQVSQSDDIYVTIKDLQ